MEKKVSVDKELALKQIAKAINNIEISYKLLDYPEELDDYYGMLDDVLSDLKQKIKDYEPKTHEIDEWDLADKYHDENKLKDL